MRECGQPERPLITSNVIHHVYLCLQATAASRRLSISSLWTRSKEERVGQLWGTTTGQMDIDQ